MPTLFQQLRRFVWKATPSARHPAARAAAELEQMLLEADYYAQANVIRELRFAIDRGDPDEAARRFSAGDIWGGSGSVSDVSFISPEENRRSWRILIRLVSAFAKSGITHPPATERASMYKKWLMLPIS